MKNLKWLRKNRQVVVHREDAIRRIRLAARAAAGVREQLAKIIAPGLSTLELDRIAEALIRNTGGISAFHGYRGFPGQICISLNDEVVHGIGRAGTVINPGDLVSVDVGVKLADAYGDTAITLVAGQAADCRDQALLAATAASLQAGIAAARGGSHVNDISAAIEDTVVRAGFSVVRDFVGHGCGLELHEPPEVPCFRQKNHGPRLEPGMVLAIEPMVNMGGGRVVVDGDGWTVRAADRSRSAHFEHMVLITNGEAEILT